MTKERTRVSEVEDTPLLPSNREAEDEVVGGIYLVPSLLSEAVASGLTPDHFYHPPTKAIYEAMLALDKRGLDITLATLLDAIKFGEAIDELELTELTTKTMTTAGFGSAVRIITDNWRKRKLIEACSITVQETFNSDKEFNELAAQATENIRSLINARELGIISVSEIEVKELNGNSWGIAALDNNTYGMVGGELTVIAGGTGDGKSMVAGQIARHVLSEGGTVGLFTLEMSGEEYKRRLTHSHAKVRMRSTRFDPPYTDEEQVKLLDSGLHIDRSPLQVVARPGIPVRELFSTIDILCDKEKPELIVIDYLQLIDMTGAEGTEAERIGYTTSGLKRLAGKHSVHILLISQFNRIAGADARYGVSDRVACPYGGLNDKGKPFTYPTPSVAHLKGSSSIEQDADRVILLQNHGFPPPDDGRDYPLSCRSHLELFVAKQRNGLSGGHGTVIKQYWEGRVRQLEKEELARIYGGMAAPVQWLREQGYATAQDKLQ